MRVLIVASQQMYVGSVSSDHTMAHITDAVFSAGRLKPMFVDAAIIVLPG